MAGRRLARHRTALAPRQGIPPLTPAEKGTTKGTQTGEPNPISLNPPPILFQLKMGLAPFARVNWLCFACVVPVTRIAKF